MNSFNQNVKKCCSHLLHPLQVPLRQVPLKVSGGEEPGLHGCCGECAALECAGGGGGLPQDGEGGGAKGHDAEGAAAVQMGAQDHEPVKK